jgi:hypothetical protein
VTPAEQLLNDLWEEHVRDEFVGRDTEATLATMAPDAYVKPRPGHDRWRGGRGAPLVAIVHFGEAKVAHEHIYWDQASVLVQLGLLDPAGLPVAGVETARKVLAPRQTNASRWTNPRSRFALVQ